MSKESTILLLLLIPLLKAFYRAAMLFLKQGVSPAIDNLEAYQEQNE